MLPNLDIIIVNWNSGKFLSECIASIKNALAESFSLNRVVIIDNSSSDNSTHGIEKIDLPIEIIFNNNNVGFAKACNQGAKNSSADYLLFLNPDTKLFDTSLSKPIEFMEKRENKDVGIIGVKIIDDNNVVSRNCAKFPNAVRLFYMSLGLDKIFPKIFQSHFMIEWDHLDSREVDQVMGSFFMIRKNVFDRLEGYDEKFFVYYEDLDLALRVKKIGLKSYYLSDAAIYHKGGGTSEKVKANRLSYNLNSKLIYCKKHFGIVAYTVIFFTTLVLEPISRIFYALIKRSMKEIPEIINGYKKLIKIIFKTSSSR